MADTLPNIVRRALLETVTDIGQLSKQEKRVLGKYTKRGWLIKGRGGPFPKLKTVYAFPGYAFADERKREIREMFITCARLGESIPDSVRFLGLEELSEKELKSAQVAEERARKWHEKKEEDTAHEHPSISLE